MVDTLRPGAPSYGPPAPRSGRAPTVVPAEPPPPAPGPPDDGRARGRARLARLVGRAVPPAVALGFALGGGALLVVGAAGYPTVRGWGDRLARDGTLESLTPDAFARLVPWLLGVGLLLLLAAAVVARLRHRLGSWLTAVTREALSPADARDTDGAPAAAPPLGRPALALLLATSGAFWALYLALGILFWRTGVLDHFDGLFHSDPPRVIRDLALPGADGRRSHLHPLFVLMVNPVGAGLAGVLGSHALSAVVLNALAGAVAVFLSQLLFHRLGMPLRGVLLWSALLGLSASQLVFAAAPETFVFAVAPLVACTLVAVREPRFLPFAAGALVCFGVTSTNLLTAALLHLGRLRRRFAASLLRTAALVVVVLGVAAALAVGQRAIYPEARYFFTPAAYQSGVFDYVPELGPASLRARAAELARHMGVYTLLAPVPVVAQTGEPLPSAAVGRFPCHEVCGLIGAQLADPRTRPADSHPAQVTFQGAHAPPLRAAGWVGVVAWLGLLLAAGREVARQPVARSRLLLGLAAGLGFQFALHLVYGDDLFLYSPHWVFLVVAAPALALRRHWHRWWLTAALAVVVGMQALNNGRFMHEIWSYFQRQTL